MEIKCPYCRKNSVTRERATWPFCSERCQQMDFGKWTSEEYFVAGEQALDPEVASELGLEGHSLEAHSAGTFGDGKDK